MIEFQYQLPNSESPQTPLAGLSTAARAALSHIVWGPDSVAQLLTEGITASEKEALLADARAQMDAFAMQILPGLEATTGRLPKGQLTSYEIEWDDGREEPAIWLVNPVTGNKFEDAVLNISHINLSGVLQLPRYLRIAQLDCSGNKLTSLPELPSSMLSLYCEDNQLTYLPNLPENLDVLACGYNRLTELPKLPQTLRILSCVSNHIAIYPTLPDRLEITRD